VIKNVLLDLDDTLLDFHRAEAEAIRHTLREFGIDPTDETIRLYSKINRSCWEKLERGEYTREEVLHRRFDILFDTLGTSGDSHATQKLYEYRLSLGAYYLDGAEELLCELYGKYRLYLATNGIVNVQSRRIKDSGIGKYFDGIKIEIISLGSSGVSSDVSKTKITVIGFMVGVVMAAVIVYVLSAMDSSIKSKEELEEISGTNLLAYIQYQGGKK
jgi:phosphoglycolate phosphatase-like HAD superfamily hydrolase